MLALGTAAHAETKSCASAASKWARQQCENYNRSAPGDEYFGRMKLSYLGINNTFHDEAIRAGAYTIDRGIIQRVGYADEALQAWAHKYPSDPQLARTYFLAIRVYQKIYTRPAQEKAWNYMHVLTARFPTSFFGKTMKTDLARGFTEHWYAEAQPCTSPAAAAAQSDPTAAPKPGQPKVEVLTPPCIQPATANPSTPNPPPMNAPGANPTQ